MTIAAGDGGSNAKIIEDKVFKLIGQWRVFNWR